MKDDSPRGVVAAIRPSLAITAVITTFDDDDLLARTVNNG